MAIEHLRCRFCDYVVPKWHTRKDGGKRSGWPKLMAHIEEQHPDDAETISDTLGTTYLGEANE